MLQPACSRSSYARDGRQGGAPESTCCPRDAGKHRRQGHGSRAVVQNGVLVVGNAPDDVARSVSSQCPLPVTTVLNPLYVRDRTHPVKTGDLSIERQLIAAQIFTASVMLASLCCRRRCKIDTICVFRNSALLNKYAWTSTTRGSEFYASARKKICGHRLSRSTAR